MSAISDIFNNKCFLGKLYNRTMQGILRSSTETLSYSDDARCTFGLQYAHSDSRRSLRFITSLARGKSNVKKLTDINCNEESQADVTSRLNPEVDELEEARIIPPKIPYDLENIVISGGGTKGYSFVGSLKALDDAGVLTRIKRVAGSSAGAICAGLVAVGCNPQEIADVFRGDIKRLFHDQSCSLLCGLPKIYSRFGINAGQKFHKVYGMHLERRTGNENITFLEVFEKYAKELVIVVTNLSQMRSEYFTYKTTPNMPIRVAVRMSMSFPGEGLKLNKYCCSNAEENRPINYKTIGLYVVSERAVDHKIWKKLFGEAIPNKPTYMPNTKLARSRLHEELTLRRKKLRDKSKKRIKSKEKDQKLSSVSVNVHYEASNREIVRIGHFGQFMKATIETVLVSQRSVLVKPEDINRTVAINCGYIGTSDYLLEAGDREFMIQQGYLHTVEFLDRYQKGKSGKENSTVSSTYTPDSGVADMNDIIASIDDVAQANNFRLADDESVVGAESADLERSMSICTCQRSATSIKRNNYSITTMSSYETDV